MMMKTKMKRALLNKIIKKAEEENASMATIKNLREKLEIID